MTRLRLLIKRPGRVNTYIPVTVESTDSIGNCITSLVDYLDMPRRDGLGRVLTYALRPLSADQPLLSTRRFADVQLPSETRLVLELERKHATTRLAGTPLPGGDAACVPGVEALMKPSHQMMTRRTVVVGSILAGCAVSGLFTGIVTAFVIRQRALPVAKIASARSSPHVSALLQQTLLFSGHQQTVRTVGWSPDDTTIASGADDGFLLLWTPNGQVQQRISHHNGVTALAWSPTGQRLVSGSGNSVRFFDGHTGALLVPARRAHTAQVTSLVWSNAAGQPVISGSLDKRAIVWETQDYLPVAVFTRHTMAIDALSTQPNSAVVASASQGGVVRVWRVDTLQELHGFYQDAQVPMRTVAFAPTGNQLAVGGNDGQVRLWSNGLLCQQSATTAQGTLCLDRPQRFHTHTAPVRAIAWSPNGQYLATGGDDGILAVWTCSQEQRPSLLTMAKLASPVLAVSWSPTHQQIAVASGKNVTIWTMHI